MTLKVTGGGIYDYCIAGVKIGATDGLDNAWDIPAPPASPDDNYIYTYFPHPEWGAVFDKYRRDIKASDLPKEWVFEVSSNISGDLTIEWPDLNNAIPDKQAVLVDVDGGGSETDMQTSSSFAFINNQNPRRFLVRISEPIIIPVPQPPENLQGTVIQIETKRGLKAAVLLYWKRNMELDLAGYNVYRSASSGSGYQKINNSLILAPKHRYTDKKVEKGKTYYYVVTAVNNSGQESGYSNEVKVIINSK
jgi:hypothetical protein